jgi:peroxiredoxin (alkyl hydroperoxide reductase subunit C)
MPAQPPGVGQHAPDFTLKDYNNEVFTLSEALAEKSVLLVFYPLAFSSTCTGELCALRDDAESFASDDVQAVAISVDSPYSLKVFADRESYEFPILSDFWPHGAVAQLYGVFNEATGFANRGTFLIDRSGVVRFAELNEVGQARDPQRWRDAVAQLAGRDPQPAG